MSVIDISLLSNIIQLNNLFKHNREAIKESSINFHLTKVSICLTKILKINQKPINLFMEMGTFNRTDVNEIRSPHDGKRF